MICLSHKGTSILIKTLSEDFDIDVHCWAEKLQERILVYQNYCCNCFHPLLFNLQLRDADFNYQNDIFIVEQLDHEGEHNEDGRSDVDAEGDSYSGDVQTDDSNDHEEDCGEHTEGNSDDDGDTSVCAPPYSPISDIDINEYDDADNYSVSQEGNVMVCHQ